MYPCMYPYIYSLYTDGPKDEYNRLICELAN